MTISKRCKNWRSIRSIVDTQFSSTCYTGEWMRYVRLY